MPTAAAAQTDMKPTAPTHLCPDAFSGNSSATVPPRAPIVSDPIDLTVAPLSSYDPTKYAGRNLAKRFRALFDETRARWLGDRAAIGIAHKAHRLRRQQRLAEMAEEMGALDH
jgi:hypothetical protein